VRFESDVLSVKLGSTLDGFSGKLKSMSVEEFLGCYRNVREVELIDAVMVVRGVCRGRHEETLHLNCDLSFLSLRDGFVIVSHLARYRKPEVLMLRRMRFQLRLGEVRVVKNRRGVKIVANGTSRCYLFGSSSLRKAKVKPDYSECEVCGVACPDMARVSYMLDSEGFKGCVKVCSDCLQRMIIELLNVKSYTVLT